MINKTRVEVYQFLYRYKHAEYFRKKGKIYRKTHTAYVRMRAKTMYILNKARAQQYYQMHKMALKKYAKQYRDKKRIQKQNHKGGSK